MPIYMRTPPSAATLADTVSERLLRERIVVLGSEVTDDVANTICGQLLLLAAESDDDVALYINSPGGSVSAGLAIFDTMEFIGNDVATHVVGLAASMGQFLLTAGTKGKRFALPRARVLMHQPSGGFGGTAADIAIQAEAARHTKRTMQELIAEHSGHTVEEIRRDFDRDRWFTATQARDYGLVDHIQQRDPAALAR